MKALAQLLNEEPREIVDAVPESVDLSLQANDFRVSTGQGVHGLITVGDPVGLVHLVGEVAESGELFFREGHPATLSADRLEREISEHRMRDTFGGYDWGDPIVLWTVRAPRPRFSAAQLAIAERVVGRAS